MAENTEEGVIARAKAALESALKGLTGGGSDDEKDGKKKRKTLPLGGGAAEKGRQSVIQSTERTARALEEMGE